MGLAKVPEELRYTREHEWLKVEGGRGRVGITDYAQDQLGDVVFVDLPEVGRRLEAGEVFGVVESVKSVSDLYSPVAGRVVEVNGALADHPERVNQDPYGEGWLVVLELEDASQIDRLLTAEQYRALTEGA